MCIRDSTYTVQNNQFKIVWNENTKVQTNQVFEGGQLLETTTLYYKLNTTLNESLLVRSVKVTPKVFESGGCYELVQESLYYGYGTECKSDGLKERDSQTVLNLTEKTISVYPNPTTDFLYITFPAFSESTKIQVCDLTGKTVLEADSENGQIEYRLDTQNLPTGSYLIRLYQGDNHFNTKFIKL